MSPIVITQFEDALLTAESGIDWQNASWYQDNLDRPVLNYWCVRAPGELYRNSETGLPHLEQVTVAQYFERLGIAWVINRLDENGLRLARYSVVNAWGFVGYQLGEALLYETGHYEPELVTWRSQAGAVYSIRSYYSGDVPDVTWSGGVRRSLHDPYGRGEMILATDVNCWRGRFSGLDGVASLSDLKNADIQKKVFRRILRHNHLRLKKRLETVGFDLADQLVKLSVKAGIQYTLSGCLAASHLCGVEATFHYLASEIDAKDETGTTLLSYLKRFSGFELDQLLLRANCGEV